MRRRSVLLSGLALVVLLLAAVTLAAASSLIDVTANAFSETQPVPPTPGAPVKLGSGVDNTSTATVSVILDTYVIYSNGLRQQVFPPQMFTLAPGEGIRQVAFVLVPQQAGLGTATLHADGHITQTEGAPPSPEDRFDSDMDTFEVAAD